MTRHVPLWWWLAGSLVAVSAAGGAQENAVAADTATAAVASVNGEAITVDDLERKLESLHGGAAPTQRAVGDLDQLLFKMINDVLIGQEARALGLQEEPPIPESIERNRQRLALAILEREEIKRPGAPRPEEIAEVFEERYRRATFHVLTAADRQGAESLLAALRRGEAIEELARSQSIDPYREQGGRLESVTRKDLQLDIADLVFSLAPHEVAGPVETDLGWSVLAVESFEPPDPLLFEDARPTLESLVRQRKESAAREALVARLRRSHEVTIDQELVASMQPVRRPDGRLTAVSPGPGTVVARVGDDVTLSGDDYAAALEARWRSIPDLEAAAAAGPIILESLITDRLLLAEAYDRGYQNLPAVERALHGLETEMVIPKYLNSVLAAGIEVSREEAEAYYEEVKGSLRRPPRLRLGQVTVPDLDEAEIVAEALRQGTDLAWLAARHSTDGLRDKGGVGEWMVVQPDGSEFNTLLLGAAVGTTLDPQPRGDSWVVYKVIARDEQGTFSFDEVSGNMSEAVFKRKFTANLDRFIKTARSRSEIEIDEAMLHALKLSASREAEEESGHGQHGGHGGG